MSATPRALSGWSGSAGTHVGSPPGEPGEFAAVRRWVETFTRAWATGDVTEMLRLSDPGCTSCGTAADLIEQVHRAGGKRVGLSASIRFQPVDVFDPVTVDTRITFSDHRFIPSERAESRAVPSVSRQHRFELQHRSDGWIVTEVGVLE